MHAKTEQQLLKWFDEMTNEDFVPTDSNSDLENTPNKHSKHSTETKQSDNEEIVFIIYKRISTSVIHYTGKDVTLWLNYKSKLPPKKIHAPNIFYDKNAKEAIGLWNIFPNNFIEATITYQK